MLKILNYDELLNFCKALNKYLKFRLNLISEYIFLSLNSFILHNVIIDLIKNSAYAKFVIISLITLLIEIWIINGQLELPFKEFKKNKIEDAWHHQNRWTFQIVLLMVILNYYLLSIFSLEGFLKILIVFEFLKIIKLFFKILYMQLCKLLH